VAFYVYVLLCADTVRFCYVACDLTENTKSCLCCTSAMLLLVICKKLFTFFIHPMQQVCVLVLRLCFVNIIHCKIIWQEITVKDLHTLQKTYEIFIYLFIYLFTSSVTARTN